MKRIFYTISFFLTYSTITYGQIEGDSLVLRDTIIKSNITQDSLGIDRISSAIADTLISDTISRYNISKDAVNEEVEWGAKGLQIVDRDSNKLKLYDNAYVNYGTITLRAGYIELDLDKKEIIGIETKDSISGAKQKATFKEKDQEFSAKLIRYNIESKKGWVEYAKRLEGDLIIHGRAGKYISKEADSINHVDAMFIESGLITNCKNEDNPHWGIRASKIKMVPNKLAVFASSVLELADIPTPIFLPFGFYPMFQGQKSGLILPQRLDRNNDFGVGFNDIGIYLALSDYFDLRITGDIYSRGTHGLRIASNYNKRYKYNGNFELRYFNAFSESKTDGSIIKKPAFSFKLVHRQDSKAHPYQKIGGNIDLSFAGYQRAANTDYRNRINNIVTSNFSYTNSLPGTPFNLSVGLNHSQNNSTRKFEITLPNIVLNMKTIYPFKSKNRIGKEKWYEKISLNYRGEAKNQINATDTTIFTNEALRNMKTGLKNRISTNATFRVFKYFNASLGLTYNEKHYLKTINKEFNSEIRIDTTFDNEGNIVKFDTVFGRIITDTVPGWKVYRNINPSMSLSTNKTKKILFNKGFIRGLKHKISYNFSLSGNPIDEVALYNRTIDTDIRPEYNKQQEYSIFGYSGAYGTSNPQKQNLILNYSTKHNIEAKYFSKKDSTTKKIPILKNLSFGGSYNVTADSLNFSTIRIGFNFSLFKNFVSFRYSGSLDPYVKVGNKRINKFVWDEKRLPFRHDFSTLNITVNSKSFGQIIEMFSKKDNSKKRKSRKKTSMQNNRFLEMIKNFKVNYDLGLRWQNNSNNIDTFYVSTHSIRLHGELPISKKWKIVVHNFSYNFKDKRFSYPDFTFERDLHCWKMNFSWRPEAGSYSFFIGVKSSVLNFIKYQHGINPIRAGLSKYQ